MSAMFPLPASWANALRVARNRVVKFIRYIRSGGARNTIEIRLLSLAGMAKRSLNPQVTYVGVTGSCGKTTTAKLIGAILAADGECHVNIDKNGERSIARGIISLGPSTKYCVNEVCGSKPGKVRKQTRILRPQIGVITAVGSDHYRNYRGLEATSREKGVLAEAVPPHGTVILNADDPHVLGMAARCRGRMLTYGLSTEAEVRGTDVSSAWPDRLQLTVTYRDQNIRIKTELVGEHWATSVLAAVACGIVCGLDLRTCSEVIARFQPPFARCSVHAIPGGPVYVIDYKSPIWTIPASLTFMAKARADRKTIVLGTISDYPGGATSARYRREALRALEVADRVVFVGPQSTSVSKLRQGELKERLFDFQTVYEAANFLHRNFLPGELILLKGSPTADHLERIMLSQIEDVVCWKQGCGRRKGCQYCANYRKPSPPPFGLVERVKPGAMPPAGDGPGAQAEQPSLAT